jgi:hypothetical protein
MQTIFTALPLTQLFERNVLRMKQTTRQLVWSKCVNEGKFWVELSLAGMSCRVFPNVVGLLIGTSCARKGNLFRGIYEVVGTLGIG